MFAVVKLRLDLFTTIHYIIDAYPRAPEEWQMYSQKNHRTFLIRSELVRVLKP